MHKTVYMHMKTPFNLCTMHNSKTFSDYKQYISERQQQHMHEVQCNGYTVMELFFSSRREMNQ
jgi:hypothetical protein